jgi:16S rRNA (guanine527-N7)-methyltransferase
VVQIENLIQAQPWDCLIPHLLRAGANPDETIPRLKRYAALLLGWNRSVSNLISKNDEARIVQRHILESLEPARLLRECEAQRWLDFGSGAGLPAIPLALAGIGQHWTLVEARRPKTLFMRKALQELKLNRNDVVNARLETWLDEVADGCRVDAFTSRATIALGPTLVLAARIVDRGGVAFLWKGSQREEEMKQDSRWKGLWDFDGLLGIGEGTTAVLKFTKII